MWRFLDHAIATKQTFRYYFGRLSTLSVSVRLQKDLASQPAHTKYCRVQSKHRFANIEEKNRNSQHVFCFETVEEKGRTSRECRHYSCTDLASRAFLTLIRIHAWLCAFCHLLAYNICRWWIKRTLDCINKYDLDCVYIWFVDGTTYGLLINSTYKLICLFSKRFILNATCTVS